MIPEQTELVKKAQSSLEAAKMLAKEGWNDYAVSRAYYCMFYVAKAFLLGEGLTFSKHSAVISAFGQHFSKTQRLPQKFHHYLIEGQTRRTVADYETKTPVLADVAAEQIARAEEFLVLAEGQLGPLS